MNTDIIKIQDIVSLLSENPKIGDCDYPLNFFDVYNESFSQEDCFISVNTGDKNIHGDEIIYDIEFDIYVSWSIVNNGGDGYWTPNYDEVEDLEIEIELKNIIGESDQDIELNDMDSIKEVKKWIEKTIVNT